MFLPLRVTVLAPLVTPSENENVFFIERMPGRIQVQGDHPSGSKAEIADRLLQLWGELDPKVVARWDSGALP